MQAELIIKHNKPWPARIEIHIDGSSYRGILKREALVAGVDEDHDTHDYIFEMEKIKSRRFWRRSK